MIDFNRLATQAIEIWNSGGWAMYALAFNAFILFLIGANLWVDMKRRYRPVSETRWKRWIVNTEERRGKVGELISFVMGATDLKDMRVRFGELQTTEISPFARDLKFMKRAISTAPLLGLLGTVTGMLTTFQGLAQGASGDKTMDLIAGGISEALITTETGLVIALPGLIFQYHLTRNRDRYATFLAHLETACTLHLYRLTRGNADAFEEARP